MLRFSAVYTTAHHQLPFLLLQVAADQTSNEDNSGHLHLPRTMQHLVAEISLYRLKQPQMQTYVLIHFPDEQWADQFP